MKKVLVDLNIILDLLNKREEHEAAAKVYDLCVKRLLKGYLCSHEITTLSYFMEKYKYSEDKRVFIINELLNLFSIIPATEKILRKALYSGIRDFEDAVIDCSAQSEEVEYIITRDIKDFKKGKTACCNAVETIASVVE